MSVPPVLNTYSQLVVITHDQDSAFHATSVIGLLEMNPLMFNPDDEAHDRLEDKIKALVDVWAEASTIGCHSLKLSSEDLRMRALRGSRGDQPKVNVS